MAPYLVVVNIHGGSMSYEAGSEQEAMKVATERLATEPSATNATIYTPTLSLQKAGVVTMVIATIGGRN
jgi:hypothetical protein